MRQSGRTTKLLKRAVEHAREGKHVTFVVHSTSFARTCLLMTLDLLEADCVVGWIRRSDGVLIGAGRIDFVTLPNVTKAMRGQRKETSVLSFDHFAWDVPMNLTLTQAVEFSRLLREWDV